MLICKRRRASVKDDPAVVLTVNPSDCSCRAQIEWDNHTLLLNPSKLLRDQAFADDEVNGCDRLVVRRGGCNFPEGCHKGGLFKGLQCYTTGTQASLVPGSSADP